MTHDSNSKHLATDRSQPTWVRRRDRNVTDEAWIELFLTHASIGTLATVSDGIPFINTNLFTYDSVRDCIYTHTAHAGRTRQNIELEPQTGCFSVMEMGRLLPAKTAREFSVEYAGVTIFGVLSIVNDPQEATQALQALLNKYAPHLRPEEDYRPPVEEELQVTTVIRLDITSWSGKKKEVTDFEGAFFYEENPILSCNQTKRV